MKPFDRPTEGAWQQKRREEGLSKHSTGSDMAWRMQGIPRGQLALVNVVNNVVHFKYEQLSLSLAVFPLSPSLYALLLLFAMLSRISLAV